MSTPVNIEEYPIRIRAVWYDEFSKQLCWINTLKLPHEEETICSNDPERIAKAIIEMEIRGAPAIGVAAALGVAAFANRVLSERGSVYTMVSATIDRLWKTRPTAYNLFYALGRLRSVLENARAQGYSPTDMVAAIEREAISVWKEDIEANLYIGLHGVELIPEGARILTHCNAGALATSAYGTATAPIRIAFYKGKRIRVFATETRPVLQGARLTVWELSREKIPVTLITDNMAGYLMRKGLVDLVIVGADRITREGYVVNKIGTYMLALAAKRNNIPFYVAAPTSTIDPVSTIESVVIEERDPREVKYVAGKLITVPEVPALNYAFDITDPDLVTAIITERGVIKPPFEQNIPRVLAGGSS